MGIIYYNNLALHYSASIARFSCQSHQENNTMLGWLEMLESTRLARITRSSFKILKKFL